MSTNEKLERARLVLRLLSQATDLTSGEQAALRAYSNGVNHIITDRACRRASMALQPLVVDRKTAAAGGDQ